MTTNAFQSPATSDTSQWLDAATRQHIVELALAGAQHGLATQARVILGALPSLVPHEEACLGLHAALLIALGDTSAARVCLTELAARGQADAPTANVLRHWLEATEADPTRRGVMQPSPVPLMSAMPPLLSMPCASPVCAAPAPSHASSSSSSSSSSSTSSLPSL
ncbi:DUF1039 domain-containing protein [Pandoraea faecigallinarum]|nr:DUF1039 domain-containing protein [Pandoraea faecigallinarum]